eukprot:NODE_489_length_1429_cov_341.093478_g369_i0.p1 GENE.NODE_489_length_1429_cov_341.093478_g369_i0~~NODE_489_length_1429_cov_341.093478_g369_i0.p1  ORF type:complete len:419 (-),score=176.71 NODE_489_length_1429_cov_341.093478_g369_i0:132-1388(-)
MPTKVCRTLADLKDEVVGVCVSGGLDSKTVCTALLEAGVKVISFSADLGQPDETDIQNVVRRMTSCGVDCHLVDLKNEMAEAGFESILCQAKYDGGYWNTTGLGRIVTVKGLLEPMKKAGCTVLSHGATGRGNDQMRFERYTNNLDPNFKVYCPWRDPVLLERFPGRSQMAAYLGAKGIEATVGVKKLYSTDANICGLSHEAEDLEHLTTPMTIVQAEFGKWPMEAPEEPEDVVMQVVAGRVVNINGKDVTPLEAMQLANTIAGRNGVGLTQALENRLLGTKSRGVYEAPGMELLGKVVENAYQATMERKAYKLFKYLSSFIADQVYDARYFDPSTQASITCCKELAKYAIATVKVRLYKGNVLYASMTNIPHCLYFEADASMEASEGLNPVSSQGYAEVQSVEARALAFAGQIAAKI